MKKCLGCGSLISDEFDRCSNCGFNSLQKIKLDIDGKEIETEIKNILDIDK